MAWRWNGSNRHTSLPMLAHYLEILLDSNSYSPQLKALWSMLLLTGFIVFAIYASKDPTHADELVTARQITCNAKVSKLATGERGHHEIWAQGMNEALPSDLEYFYKQPEYDQIINAMNDTRFPYEKALPYSLALQARAGNILSKKNGALTAKLMQGDSIYEFQYKCPFHSYLF